MKKNRRKTIIIDIKKMILFIVIIVGISLIIFIKNMYTARAITMDNTANTYIKDPKLVTPGSSTKPLNIKVLRLVLL